nr:hypothetical protein [Planctomycetales bacterium]
MKSPWQQRFFGWYVIALAAGLVLILLWIIFQIHQINREMQRAEDKARLLAREFDPVLQMSNIYAELAQALPLAIPRLKAAVDAFGESRQQSAWEDYRRER